jgi:hypothetical protein
MRPAAVLSWVIAALAGVASASDTQEILQAPAVARPVFGKGLAQSKPGTVFFLRSPLESGAVAIGTAHNVSFDVLSAAPEVRFELGHTEKFVSASSRLLLPPGRPFQQAGGSLTEDFLVYALDLVPLHVRLLDAKVELPASGTRVRLLGIPSTVPHDEDDVYGTVSVSSAERIEVDLDVPFDLRGWGGAPILDKNDETVVGILQAAFPREKGLTIVATPIGAVLAALEHPLEGGLGRPFASFPAPRPSPRGGRPAGKPERQEAPAPTKPAPATVPSARKAPDSMDQLARDLASIEQPSGEGLVMEIGYPPDGSILGASVGAFVAGRALAPLGEYRAIDVAFVIDTSQSTADPTGVDVNGNGVVGEHRFGPFGTTDPGDSILAAEVAAARYFVQHLDPRSTRVALITFAGEPPDQGGGMIVFGGRSSPPAVTEVALTTDFADVERALERILKRGPQGATHMAAGADQATIELLGLRGSVSEPRPDAEKVAIFLTDGQPTLPYGAMFPRDNTRAVIRAAGRADKAQVRFHTFGIGDQALDGPVGIVELAHRTGGEFTPVRHPGDLVDVISEVRFVDIESVTVTNETNGITSSSVLQNPDGSWSALVPLEVGENRIQAVATSSDGHAATAWVTVHYAPGSPNPIVPNELVMQRNELLQGRLLELRRDRIATERAAAETTRRELKIEIERERAAARERADRQRKELELEAIREDGVEGAEDAGPP